MISLCNLESLVYILYVLALENRRRLARVEAVQDYAYHMYPYGYHASGLYCIRMCLCMYVWVMITILGSSGRLRLRCLR